MTRHVCLWIVLLALALVQTVRAQDAVTGNLLSRTFEIRVTHGQMAESGTAFIVEYQGRQYAITAEHLVAGLPHEAMLEVYVESAWKQVPFMIWHGNTNCNDVAVITPPGGGKIVDGTLYDIPLGGNFPVGQALEFMGFPYGLFSPVKGFPRPIPLLKHGYVSGVASCSVVDPSWKGPGDFFLIDGFNNPGFSGGPVVYADPNKPDHPLTFMGVVHGYRSAEDQIVARQGVVGDARALSNSGIMIVVPINEATKLLKQASDDLEKAAHK